MISRGGDMFLMTETLLMLKCREKRDLDLNFHLDA